MKVRACGALLAGALLIAVPAAAQNQPLRTASTCGNARVYYTEYGTQQYIDMTSIRTHHVKCKRARKVARAWARDSRLSCCPAAFGAGFDCAYHRLGSDIGKVTCREGDRYLKFDAYDSSPYH